MSKGQTKSNFVRPRTGGQTRFRQARERLDSVASLASGTKSRHEDHLAFQMGRSVPSLPNDKVCHSVAALGTKLADKARAKSSSKRTAADTNNTFFGNGSENVRLRLSAKAGSRSTLFQNGRPPYATDEASFTTTGLASKESGRKTSSQ